MTIRNINKLGIGPQIYSCHPSPSLFFLGRNGQITATLETITIQVHIESIAGGKPATYEADFFCGNYGMNANCVTGWLPK